MDYILRHIEKKIRRFEGSAESKVYHQVRVEYSLNLLLAYIWNKNFNSHKIDFVTKGNIIQEIQRPSIGTIANIIQKLDIEKEIKSSSLTEYAAVRNDLIGHGYSFEDDLDNYSNLFDTWYNNLQNLRIPILSRNTNIIVCRGYDEETESFFGTLYDFNGDENNRWRCPKGVFNFEIGNLYASFEANLYFRLSPFIHINEQDDGLYVYRNVQQPLLGQIRYNRIDRSENDFTVNWPEFEFTANNGVVKKQPNGAIINLFDIKYKKYIEVGSIKEKLYSFLTGKKKNSSVCVTLWGHGGNGKTATAQKICEELSLASTPGGKKPHFDYIVFLSAKDRELNKFTGRINSINSENRVTSFEELIEKLNIVLYNKDSHDISDIVSDKNKLLLIIDDYETFEDIDKEKITDFISELNINHHKVIITTRNSFLKIGDDIPTNELDESNTIKFLIEILINEHNYSKTQITEIERDIKRGNCKQEIHKITLGKPIEIIRFANCFVQKGKISPDFLREIERINSRSERNDFFYGRNYKQLEGDKMAQDIFVVIGLLTPQETLTSLSSHLKLILNIKDEEENSFYSAIDKIVKLRLLEIDEDGSYKVDSKDILAIMKLEFDKRDDSFKGKTKAIYDRIKSNITLDTDRALLNHVKSLRHQSSPETTIQQYKEIIRQGKDFSEKSKLEALFDLGDFLFNHKGEKEEAVKLFDEYFDKFYDFNVAKRYASYSWSINKEKTIRILADFYAKHSSKGIQLSKNQKVHLLALIVMREGQYWNDKFERDFNKRSTIKDQLYRINKAYGHFLYNHMKLSNIKDYNSEELFDISSAFETYVDLLYRISNKAIAIEICDFILTSFPEKYSIRFKKRREKFTGDSNTFKLKRNINSKKQSASIISSIAKKKVALNEIKILNLAYLESGYNGKIMKLYNDTNYGYIEFFEKGITGRVYFKEKSLVDTLFHDLKLGDQVEFGFGKINSYKEGAINVKLKL